MLNSTYSNKCYMTTSVLGLGVIMILAILLTTFQQQEELSLTVVPFAWLTSFAFLADGLCRFKRNSKNLLTSNTFYLLAFAAAIAIII